MSVKNFTFTDAEVKLLIEGLGSAIDQATSEVDDKPLRELREKLIGTPKIEQWSLTLLDFSPFTAPEGQKIALHGKVYGHPDHPDGTEVTTSEIIAREKPYMVTQSRRYLLGNPHPDYLAGYPGCETKVWGPAKAVYVKCGQPIREDDGTMARDSKYIAGYCQKPSGHEGECNAKA